MYRNEYSPILDSGHPLNRGLLAWLPMNDTGGGIAYDISLKNANGVISGSPRRVGGEALHAMQFLGTSDVIAIPGAKLPIHGIAEMTISARVRRTALLSHVTVGRSVLTNRRFNINLFNDGNVYFNVDTGAATAYGSIALNDTKWHNIVMVFNGNLTGNAERLKVYIDGRLTSLTITGTIPATTATTADEFTIGRNQSGTTYSTGFIQNVRVWNRALTALEAQLLSSEPFAGMYFPSPGRYFITASGGFIKSLNGLAWASVKSRNGLAVAQIKSINGLAAQ